jgi:hypothetical protein
MIDFTALNRGFNPGRFIVADEDERNILKMFNDRSQFALKDFPAAYLQAIED